MTVLGGQFGTNCTCLSDGWLMAESFVSLNGQKLGPHTLLTDSDVFLFGDVCC